MNSQLLAIGVLFAFLFGITIGSFLNVCIYRLPLNMSVNFPPSHCPNCKHRLGAADLFPLFSFLFLGRKCRYCKQPISWTYFCRELLTGILFVCVFLKFGYSWDTVFYALFTAGLIVAFFTDLETYIIPDSVNIALCIFGLAKDITGIIVNSGYAVGGGPLVPRYPIPFTDFSFPMLPSVLGMLLCGGAFWLITVIGYRAFMPKDPSERENYEGAMGMGDVFLAAGIGAVLGARKGFVSFLLAIFLGTFIGIGVIAARKRKGDSKGEGTMIPFGPFMAAGAVAVMFFYPYLCRLWQMWLNLFA
ncbi:MAG: prepilin peptidase [Abditibacteriota bacterium]|nr:prepilin peptidase [Abditibacteriota bacterium]